MGGDGHCRPEPGPKPGDKSAVLKLMGTVAPVTLWASAGGKSDRWRAPGRVRTRRVRDGHWHGGSRESSLEAAALLGQGRVPGCRCARTNVCSAGCRRHPDCVAGSVPESDQARSTEVCLPHRVRRAVSCPSACSARGRPRRFRRSRPASGTAPGPCGRPRECGATGIRRPCRKGSGPGAAAGHAFGAGCQQMDGDGPDPAAQVGAMHHGIGLDREIPATGAAAVGLGNVWRWFGPPAGPRLGEPGSSGAAWPVVDAPSAVAHGAPHGSLSP